MGHIISQIPNLIVIQSKSFKCVCKFDIIIQIQLNFILTFNVLFLFILCLFIFKISYFKINIFNFYFYIIFIKNELSQYITLQYENKHDIYIQSHN